MKIRILSDLHLDINEEVPFSLADREIFTVICGDISANTAQAVTWINENIRRGVFVEGNHIGYDSKHSIQYHAIRKLQPSDCRNMFDATLKSIKLACEMFPNKKIVVVTHHAPSEQSISPLYKTDKCSPAFASNLEWFILNYPNIVLWCHGHIHSRSDYFIDKCRVICNPRGYEYREDSNFDSNFIIEI